MHMVFVYLTEGPIKEYDSEAGGGVGAALQRALFVNVLLLEVDREGSHRLLVARDLRLAVCGLRAAKAEAGVRVARLVALVEVGVALEQHTKRVLIVPHAPCTRPRLTPNVSAPQT